MKKLRKFDALNYPRYHLFIDQYGGKEWARSLKELKEKVGPGRVSKQYVDKKDGTTVHCGYVIGRRWFTRYIPWEKQA